MRIRYTRHARHARQRMYQRGITEEDVSEVLTSPDQLLQGEQGEMIAVKYFGIRELRVIFIDIDEVVVKVITVIKTRIRNE